MLKIDGHWILDTGYEHSISLTGVDRVCALSRRFDGSMWPAAVWLIWRSQRVWSSKQRRKQKVATSSQEFRTRMLSASSKKTFKCLAAKRPNRSHCDDDDGRDGGPTSALTHTHIHRHTEARMTSNCSSFALSAAAVLSLWRCTRRGQRRRAQAQLFTPFWRKQQQQSLNKAKSRQTSCLFLSCSLSISLFLTHSLYLSLCLLPLAL